MAFDVAGAMAAGHTAADIVGFLSTMTPDAAGFDVPGAKAAGYSDDDIVGALKDRGASTTTAVSSPAPTAAPPQDTPPAPPDTSFGSALRSGLHGAAEGLAATGRLVRREAGDNMVGQAGQWVADHLHGAVSAPQNYQPASASLSDAYKRGDVPALLSAAGRMGVEMVPDVGATMLAGAVADVPGVVGYVAARNAGDNAEAVARNNGHASPTGMDDLQGVATLVPQAVLQLGGLGRLAPVRRGLDAVPGVLRPVARAGVEGGANAGADAAQQAGTSIGTERGLSVDPGRVLEAGIGGAVARGIHEVPGAIGSAARAGSDQVMSRVVEQPASRADAASIVRVSDMLQTRKEQEQRTRGGDPSASNVANSLRSELTGEASDLLRTIRRSGTVSEDTRGTLDALLDLSRRHNKGLGEAGEGETGTALDRLRRADDLDVDTRDRLEAVFRDLDTLSRAARDNRQGGPLEAVGRVAGVLGGIAEGAATYNVPGALVAIAGKGHLAKLGGLAGSVADSVLGLKTPTVLLRAQAARRALRGDDPGADTFSTLRDLSADFQARGADLDGALGLRNTPAARMSLADVLAAPPDQLATAAQWAGATPERLLDGARQGFTPSDVRRSVGLQEQAGRQVEGIILERAKARQRVAQRAAAEAAAGQAADQAMLDKQGAAALVERAAQERAAHRQRAEQGAADTAREAAWDRAQQEDAAAKAAQEDAMFSTADKATKTAAQVTAKQTAGEMAAQAAGARSAALKQAAGRKAMAVFQQARKAADTATTRNETAANQVSGIAYRSPAAQALRAQGVVGAPAAASAGVSPEAAFTRTVGQAGSPAASMVDATGRPVRVAGLDAATAPRVALGAAKVRARGAVAPATPDAATPPGHPGDVPLMLGKAGWKAYVQQAARDQHGIHLHEPDMNAAVDKLTAAGRFTPEQGDAMKARTHLPLDNPEVAAAVLDVAQSALRSKMHGDNPPPPPRPGATSSRPPVRDPMRWQAAREDAKQHAADLEASARKMGDNALAEGIRDIAQEKTAAGKRAIAERLLKQAKGARRGIVKSHLPDRLLKGV